MMIKLGSVIIDTQIVAAVRFVREGGAITALITVHGMHVLRGTGVTADEMLEAGRALVGRTTAWPVIEEERPPSAAGEPPACAPADPDKG